MRLFTPIRTPQWISWFYPSFLWGVPNSKAIYLTFDDGPTPETTPEILALLKAYNAKATFFCVGNNVEKHPSLFKEIIEQGHSWGNHTFYHNDLKNTPPEEYRNSTEKSSAIMEKHAKQRTTLFRPPQGRFRYNFKKILGANYKVVFWTLLSMDHAADSSIDSCTANLLKAKHGDIVVLHDNLRTKETTLKSLEAFLKWAQKNEIILLGLPMK
ncbi:MAG TPA: polysaccharide deacetylase family protein [Flavobacteriaceae bacterium]|nr:polysaccharide deacetylase family protein [Flavobacteriaceae bacterium]